MTRIPRAQWCAACASFCNAPDALERAFAGLAAMGSGRASVRSADGLCSRHGLYLPCTATCPDHMPAAARPAG